MHPPSPCPEPPDLERFLLGQLAGPAADALEHHLEDCPRCGQTLHTLQAQDTLLSAIRDAPRTPIPPPVGARDGELLQRLKRLRAASAATVPEGTTTPPAGTAEWRSMLAPAEGPDELGRLGGYRVLKVLGAGGMGVVFLAEDPRLGRRVALKVMKPELAAVPSARERFQVEARAMAQLKSDHVVTVYQVGEDRGVPFLAMELLEGESLQDRLVREGRLPVPEVLRVGREAARGLAAAHARGLVHRDVKPANLWLEAPNGRGKVLDFGLARADTDSHLTQSGMLLGTPGYVSPEQARGKAVDARTDLFSLGCVLYRACTGEPPFRGGDYLSTLLAVAEDQPPPPRQLNPGVPAALEELIVRLLAKDPAQRPASARAVVEAVEAIERARAAPPPLPTPARRPRWPVAVPAGLAALAAAAVVLGVVLTLQSPDGTLLVKIDDPNVEARFKDGELRLYDADGKLQYTLKPSEKNRTLPPGDYRIEVTGADGLTLSTDRFEMQKNGRVTVRVLLDPTAVAGKDADRGKPAPVPADKEKPFLLLRAGNPAGEFKTFAGAQTNLQDGDVVEVYGNGPFDLGKVELKGKTLTLKAAPGYRPRFLPHVSVFAGDFTWFTAVDGGLTLEGCDFVGRPPAAEPPHGPLFLKGENAALAVRNCRVLSFYELASVSGKGLRIEDSLIVAYVLPHLGPKTECLFQNNVMDVGVPGPLAEPGGQRIRMTGNTLCFAGGFDAGLWQALPGTRDVTVHAEGNLFDIGLGDGGPGLPLARLDWRGRVTWQGSGNLYRGLSCTSPDGKEVWKGLEGWARLTGQAEQGSREAGAPIGYALNDTRTHGMTDVLAAVRQAVEEGRRQSGIDDLGPDFSLIGPGEAYVKALAAGRAVPRDQLRPEAEVGGPCVLLRGGKGVGGFPTLQEAVKDARDGDVVEVRSDDAFAGFSAPADRGTLTVRAGPGYRPVIEKDGINAVPGTALVLEGLHFRGSVIQAPQAKDVPTGRQGRIARLANCSFELAKVDENGPLAGSGLLQGVGDRPAEIVNCWMPYRIDLHGPGSGVQVRNSVLGSCRVYHREAGSAALDLDRCAVWWMEHGSMTAAFYSGPVPGVVPVPKTDELRVTARRTLFESGTYLIHADLPVKWSGERNLYRLAVSWVSDQECFGLTKWQALKDVKEEGSAEADARAWDPRRWRLLPTSPGYRAGPDGKDAGADLSRVAIAK
jgi:serine/threonine protein kinase